VQAFLASAAVDDTYPLGTDTPYRDNNSFD